MSARYPLRRAGVALLCLVLVEGCAEQEQKEPKPLPLKVYFAGCEGVLEGPVCLLGPEESPKINLWVETDKDARVAATLNGVPLSVEEEKEPGGRKVKVTFPAGAKGELRLSATRQGAEGAWTLLVEREEACPAYDRALELKKERKLEESLAHIDEHTSAATPYCAAQLYGLKGRILAINLDRIDEGLAAFRRAIEFGKAAGEMEDLGLNYQKMAFHMVLKKKDFSAASKWAKELNRLGDDYFPAKLRNAYLESQIYFETGEFRKGLESNEFVIEWTHRLGMVRLAIGVWQEQARISEYIGDFSKAYRSMDSCLKEDMDVAWKYARVSAQANMGWALFLKTKAQGKKKKEEYELSNRALNDAVKAFDESSYPLGLATVYINKAILALYLEDLEESKRNVGDLRQVSADIQNKFVSQWLLELEARVSALEGDHAKAIELFEKLGESAPFLSETRLRAAIGRADSLRAMGKDKEAVAAYLQVESMLDRHVRAIPVSAGQGTFLESKSRPVDDLIELLLEMNRTEDALAAARRGLHRALWELERDRAIDSLSPKKRQEWFENVKRYKLLREENQEIDKEIRVAPRSELPLLEERREESKRALLAALDELYRGIVSDRIRLEDLDPEPGELVLVYYPLESGLLCFAVTGEGAKAVRTFMPGPDGAGEQLSRALLHPVGEELAAASKVTGILPPELQHVDVHGLPWKGRPLLEALPVRYSLGLSDHGGGVEATSSLVVTDPTADLPGARLNKDLIVSALARTLGGRIISLHQKQATREAVAEALERAGFFHFSGHAKGSEEGNLDGYLSLASGERLTIADILSLGRAPKEVVLDACESGTVGEKPGAAPLGLAQAFVLSGSDTVVATSRTLDDTTATEFSKLLYKAYSEDLETTARRAQLELMAKCSECDWGAFRVLKR